VQWDAGKINGLKQKKKDIAIVYDTTHKDQTFEHTWAFNYPGGMSSVIVIVKTTWQSVMNLLTGDI
jgi:hypothetical protein